MLLRDGSDLLLYCTGRLVEGQRMNCALARGAWTASAQMIYSL